MGPTYSAAPRAWHRAALALTFLFVLTAVSVSTGLVVHTAWKHDLGSGVFALLFAVLSARAALSWRQWHGGEPPPASPQDKV